MDLKCRTLHKGRECLNLCWPAPSSPLHHSSHITLSLLLTVMLSTRWNLTYISGTTVSPDTSSAANLHQETAESEEHKFSVHQLCQASVNLVCSSVNSVERITPSVLCSQAAPPTRPVAGGLTTMQLYKNVHMFIGGMLKSLEATLRVHWGTVRLH